MEIVPVDQIPLGNNIEFSDEIWEICQELETKCREWKGVGLSAVQVGLPYNLFVIIIDDIVRFYANADYKALNSNFYSTVEGCLSLPGKYYKVLRPSLVAVTGHAVTPQGFVDVTFEATGLMSTVVQHEIDHAKGILIDQIGEFKRVIALD